MPLPAALLAGLAEAATNKAVRAAALRLSKEVYGRIMPAAKTTSVAPAPRDASAELAAAIAGLATKDEIAASFALLQAELDRRHRRTTALLAAVGAVQVAGVVLIILR